MSSTIEEVRALLAHFATSPWRDLHFRSGGWALFMAKGDGTANPMRGDAARAVMPTLHDVTAPHLGIFAGQVAVGERVANGTLLCRLQKLDEYSDVCSDRDGHIVAIHRRDGDLVEYGEPLVEIAVA